MSELTYEEVDYQSSEDDDDDSENGSHYQSIVRATFEKYESQSKFSFNYIFCNILAIAVGYY